MRQVLDKLTEKYPKPTPEDLKRAKEELVLNEGKFLAGVKVYLSENPAIRNIQIRCWAYRFVVKRHGLGAKVEPTLTAEEQYELEEQKLIQQDKAVTTGFMGRESIFAGISLWDKSTIQTKVVQWLLHDFNYSKKSNCILIGAPGCGKTFGAVGYAATKAGSADRVKFITAYKLSEMQLRKDFAFLDAVERVQWLIIDEFGTVPTGYKLTEFNSYFENLFSTRHRNQKKTILTSNLNVEQIKQLCGERFTSRFNEDGEIFISDDKDLRG